MKAVIKGTSHCNHGNNEYTLTMEIDNAHIGISTFPYEKGGNSTDIDIFDLTPEDMLDLADKITKTANLIISLEKPAEVVTTETK